MLSTASMSVCLFYVFEQLLFVPNRFVFQNTAKKCLLALATIGFVLGDAFVRIRARGINLMSRIYWYV
jgi:hypothetical protein